MAWAWVLWSPSFLWLNWWYCTVANIFFFFTYDTISTEKKLWKCLNIPYEQSLPQQSLPIWNPSLFLPMVTVLSTFWIISALPHITPPVSKSNKHLPSAMITDNNEEVLLDLVPVKSKKSKWKCAYNKASVFSYLFFFDNPHSSQVLNTFPLLQMMAMTMRECTMMWT